MSEEEIIKNIKHYLNITEYHRKQEYENFDTYIQGLLDLYNKEKEKNRALEHLLELKRKRIKKLSELIEECGDDE